MWVIYLTHDRGTEPMYFTTREEARHGARWYRTMSNVTATTAPARVGPIDQCGGRNTRSGHGDPRCGRIVGHQGPCDWQEATDVPLHVPQFRT